MTNLDRMTNPTKWLSSSEGVADRGAEAGNIPGTVVRVVVNQVNARLGADEEAALGIKLDAGAEVPVEVVTGLVIRATIGAAGGSRVEAGAQRADAADQLQVGVACELGRVDGIEVIKKRTKIVAGAEVIVGLGCSPVDFGPDTNMVPEDHVAAKTGIGAAGERRARQVGRGRCQRADAESQVDFLSLREIRERRQGSAGKRQEDSDA